MTTPLFRDAVSIDTNIFEHLLNPQNNVNGHINSLLVHLQEQGIALLLDDRNRISGEYYNRIGPKIGQLDDLRNEVFLLRYWILSAPRLNITVDWADPLMKAIRKVIVEQSEAVDCIFVYVALTKGKVLISNDEAHIVIGPATEHGRPPRRRRLLVNSKRLRPKGAEILNSLEAHDRIS